MYVSLYSLRTKNDQIKIKPIWEMIIIYQTLESKKVAKNNVFLPRIIDTAKTHLFLSFSKKTLSCLLGLIMGKVFAPLLSLEKKCCPPSFGMSKNILAPFFSLKKTRRPLFSLKKTAPPFSLGKSRCPLFLPENSHRPPPRKGPSMYYVTQGEGEGVG